MCLGGNGYTPIPTSVIQQDDHSLYRSIVWDPSRPCYSQGCYVCSASVSNPFSDEYKTCFESSWSTNRLDLSLYNLASPSCQCDERFVQAWFSGTWVGCAHR